MRRIGVDIGGTFTDVVLVTDQGVTTVKVASNKADPIAAIREGVRECMRRAGCEGSTIDVFAHGTTIGTNAVLERKGGEPVLVTTKGFRDVLELGTLKRPAEALYNLKFLKPPPLIARSRRLEVDERIDSAGGVHKALDEREIARIVAQIAAIPDVKSVAICLLFAFKNNAHERELAAAIRTRFPQAFVAVSSEVLPVIKEFERTAYVGLCAYLGPLVRDYLTAMAQSIGVHARRGYFVMQSHDGLRSAEASIARPADIVLSGPAAGVVGARLVGKRSGCANVISLDIGGTSTDVSLIEQGTTKYSTEKHIDHIPLTVPMMDIHTIGAGGGSKIWLDSAHGLRVGPQSTGAVPGPACYGRGGTEASITDAQVVLGYLNPETLLGGEMNVFKPLAEQVMQGISEKLGLSLVEAARGATRIFVNAVQGAIRVVSIERGHDPREFTLVAFGGAGPTHSCEVADELGIRRVLVPPFPGLTSALGLLAADASQDAVRMLEGNLLSLPPEGLEHEFEELARTCRERLQADGVAAGKTERVIEMRFPGQNYTIPVPVAPETFALPDSRTLIAADFAERHKTLYGFTHAAETAQIFCIRAKVIGEIGGGWPSEIRLSASAKSPREHKPVGHRPISFIAQGPAESPVYLREELAVEVPLPGPAVIEQYDTTTVLPAGWTAVQEASGNLSLTKGRPHG
ncbi:MAG: hydantoinase/oxoprolinase family protein [Hyphomicrobiaceae bacterium]